MDRPVGYTRCSRSACSTTTGSTTAPVFDAIADEAVKTNRLLTYDVRRLLKVEPSAAAAAIEGLRGCSA